MTSSRDNRPSLPFIAELCDDLSESELRNADKRFWDYVEIVRQIHERTERTREQPSQRRFDNLDP